MATAVDVMAALTVQLVETLRMVVKHESLPT
jgi:hypothetical protein